MAFFLCGGIYIAFFLTGVFSSRADHADITLFQLPGKDIPLTAVVVSVCSGAKQAALCCADTWRCRPGPNANALLCRRAQTCLCSASKTSGEPCVVGLHRYGSPMHAGLCLLGRCEGVCCSPKQIFHPDSLVMLNR